MNSLSTAILVFANSAKQDLANKHILRGEELFDDGKGHTMIANQPIAVCDKTAAQLADLNRNDLYISESTYHYNGGGCC